MDPYEGERSNENSPPEVINFQKILKQCNDSILHY